MHEIEWTMAAIIGLLIHVIGQIVAAFADGHEEDVPQIVCGQAVLVENDVLSADTAIAELVAGAAVLAADAELIVLVVVAGYGGDFLKIDSSQETALLAADDVIALVAWLTFWAVQVMAQAVGAAAVTVKKVVAVAIAVTVAVADAQIALVLVQIAATDLVVVVVSAVAVTSEAVSVAAVTVAAVGSVALAAVTVEALGSVALASVTAVKAYFAAAAAAPFAVMSIAVAAVEFVAVTVAMRLEVVIDIPVAAEYYAAFHGVVGSVEVHRALYMHHCF